MKAKTIVLCLVSIVSTTYACTDTSGMPYPNPEKCKNFFMCLNGEQIEFTCPGDSYFNPDKTVCEKPTNGECGSGTTHDDGGGETTTQGSGLVNCEATGIHFHPHPFDCSKFFKCVDGRRYEFTCPENTYFNPTTNGCDWIQNVDCHMILLNSMTTA